MDTNEGLPYSYMARSTASEKVPRMYATALDGFNNASSHGFWIRYHDTTETHVDDLLTLLVGRIDKLYEVIWWCPFVLAYFGIIEEPIS